MLDGKPLAWRASLLFAALRRACVLYGVSRRAVLASLSWLRFVGDTGVSPTFFWWKVLFAGELLADVASGVVRGASEMRAASGGLFLKKDRLVLSGGEPLAWRASLPSLSPGGLPSRASRLAGFL